ncbi:hypothetical protein GCM10009740_12460 [Terrabacter terrae]|uniref:Uncharacterized protein n=1 Tax=Terrabacter terrae TaxID=318434 RepID=A0ABN2TZA2_9MICO
MTTSPWPAPAPMSPEEPETQKERPSTRDTWDTMPALGGPPVNAQPSLMTQADAATGRTVKNEHSTVPFQ